ncbi:TPA: head completion/stabilization protein [Citrobacter farmeri]|uniref:head completion/stabilization protein n=1 Tax=Citrobacter TaxID=544 RepID=UPI00050EB040|nr:MULTISPECIES: head completion/stabilization protein [Citrobacter]QXA96742.1 head completion/stabilization protein [Citrobacter farmeri]QZA37044.1 head completion/stabilization protein [Citrobacter amalonaticus]GAL51576.1 putative phage capsid completion protein [Citrobacter farmeri GTC 1319]HCD1277133.1 head completion/stabilization protein [Citrobacter amalonaticus]
MTTVILNQPDEPQDVPGVVIPAPEKGDAVIKNTFFFPDVDPKRVRELMRLEQTVSDARLRNAIKIGMAETNAELYDYRLRQIAAGFKQLADVPDAEEIDGENVRVFHYLSAVTAMATATLYERYRGVEATGKGDKKADSVETTIDDLWRDMRWSVSRLQDKPRCIVGQL